MIDILLCSFTNMFRVYLIYKFIHIFFERKSEQQVKEILAYGSFYIINTVLFCRYHEVWINILSNLIGIGCLVCIYTKQIKSIFFITCSIYFIQMGCDTIATLPFISYQDGESFTQVYFVITVFLILVCELLTERIVSERRQNEAMTDLSLSLIPLGSVVMLSLLIFTDSCTEKGLVILCIGLLIVNFFTYYLYNRLAGVIFQKYENEVLRQKVESFSHQMEIIMSGEEKVKALQHDMKHHMNEIKVMARKQEYEAIQGYIEDMKEFIENPNDMVSSGNMEIDSVLNYMLHRAKSELNTVNVKVQIPNTVHKSFDLNIILGNLLENAIKAAKQTEEKLLNVLIQEKQGVLHIEIENSYEGKIEYKNNIFLTTKKDKESHGIGLSSVKRMVEKYHGLMEIEIIKRMFCVKIILYMEWEK